MSSGEISSASARILAMSCSGWQKSSVKGLVPGSCPAGVSGVSGIMGSSGVGLTVGGPDGCRSVSESSTSINATPSPIAWWIRASSAQPPR
jgi:hypothetical protein